MLAGAVYLPDITPILPRQGHTPVAPRRQVHHLAEADNQVEGGAQLVADVGHELLFQTTRLLRLLAGPRQFIVHAPQAVTGLVQRPERAVEFSLTVAKLLLIASGFHGAVPGPMEDGVQIADRQRGDNGRQADHQNRKNSLRREKGPLMAHGTDNRYSSAAGSSHDEHTTGAQQQPGKGHDQGEQVRYEGGVKDPHSPGTRSDGPQHKDAGCSRYSPLHEAVAEPDHHQQQQRAGESRRGM